MRGFVGFLEHVFSAGLVKEFAGGGVERDGHLLARLVAGRNDGFQNDLNGFFVGFAAGSKTALIAHGSGVAVPLQGGFERVENFDAPAERFAESGSADGHGHEFLKIHGAIGVGAAIEDIHHGNGKQVGGVVGGIAREVFVERLLESDGGGAGRGHGDGEDSVGAEAGFRGRAVESDHFVIESALVGGVGTNDGFGDFGVDVGDGFMDAFSQILGLVAIAEFDGFVFAGRGAGWNSGAAKRAGFEGDFGFDGGIAARVKDLAAVNPDDFGGHGDDGSWRM